MARDDSTQHAMSEQIAALRDDITGFTNTLSGYLRTRSADLAEGIKGEASVVAGSAKQIVSDRYESVIDDLSKEMQRKPLQALAVAVCAGALLGLLARSR